MMIRNTLLALLSLLLLTAMISVHAQEQPDDSGARMTLNFVETDIREVAGSIGQITGKNFILDPRVKGRVTVVSSTPISTDAVYETFLSVLQVNNFAAVPAGKNMIKIIPAVDARSMAGNDLPRNNNIPTDDMVTQVVEVQNINASQLVPILRPLIPQTGHLAAFSGSNMLIISDRAGNVQRMMRIIDRIDRTSDDDVEVITLEHASASETVRVISQLTRNAQADASARPPTLVADDRTNSVLISGDKADRLRLRALISHLDTPLESGGNTQVVYLRYASAENLAGILQSQVSETQQQQSQGGDAAAGSRGDSAFGNAVILHEPDTNALVITAAPKTMRTLQNIIEKLDIRRAQVHVEAIIAEISSDNSAELGVQWAVEGTGSNQPIAMSNFPQGDGTSIGAIGAAVASDDSTGLAGLANAGGLTLGFGRIVSGSTSFVGLLRALTGNSSTNILSTPSITTMDNEEATIEVGQEVPFRTGQYTNTGGNQGSVNPFQTIQREDVGLSLKVTPKISDSETISLKIEQEVSSLAQGVQGAADLVTNKRTITTSVLAENGEIIVLGGLIDDQVRESESAVPVLGAIPLLGELFRYRSSDKVKRNLMVFMKPSIMRDARDAAMYTNEKYKYIRQMQGEYEEDEDQYRPRDVQLMYGEEQPLLPETGKSADLVPPLNQDTDSDN
ncbi:MAG: type II secretion system secretin GspD [Gammaproteobacteria bacterium]|nr:type II secretion system secretin GspD [Gammaproteobacteria bacterium]